MVKVVGIVGSPRKGGNTEFLVNEALKAAAEEGVEIELITLADKDIKPCDGCRTCRETGNCHIQDDLKPIVNRVSKAEGLILGSPVYIGSAPSQVKAFIDRVGYLAGGKARIFENKVGGPIVVARRSGQAFTFMQLVFFFFYTGMIIPGSIYWPVAFGWKKGDAAEDEEGTRIVREFGKKVARLAKKLFQQ